MLFCPEKSSTPSFEVPASSPEGSGSEYKAKGYKLTLTKADKRYTPCGGFCGDRGTARNRIGGELLGIPPISLHCDASCQYRQALAFAAGIQKPAKNLLASSHSSVLALCPQPQEMGHLGILAAFLQDYREIWSLQAHLYPHSDFSVVPSTKDACQGHSPGTSSRQHRRL